MSAARPPVTPSTALPGREDRTPARFQGVTTEQATTEPDTPGPSGFDHPESVAWLREQAERHR